MKLWNTLLWGTRDGGQDSNVKYYGLEFKRLFSITVLCFGKGSRPVYHSHAFNSISWVISGGLRERQLQEYDEGHILVEKPSLYHYHSLHPIFTYRSTYHMVEGIPDKTWVISFRGPWKDRWEEYHPEIDKSIVLTHGRKEVDGTAG